MCGIAGIRRYGEQPITEDQIRLLLCSLQHRGADATGIATLTGGELAVHKADLEAWRFVCSKEFQEFLKENLTPETETVLLHTRFATIGNPRENKNNHPLTSRKTAIVHNGSVTNHVSVFEKLKIPRFAETDSDAIRAMVDEYGITPKVIKEMDDELNGAIAAAAISTEYPDKLLILRSGSPLVLAKVGEHLIWASEKYAIFQASKPWGEWKGLYVQQHQAPMQIIATPKDSGWIFGPKGLEYHGEFKTCSYYTKPDYTRVRTEFSTRQARWDREYQEQIIKAEKSKDNKKAIKYSVGKVDYYICRNTLCRQKLSIPPKMVNTPPHLIYCPQCNWSLEAVPEVQLN